MVKVTIELGDDPLELEAGTVVLTTKWDKKYNCKKWIIEAWADKVPVEEDG